MQDVRIVVGGPGAILWPQTKIDSLTKFEMDGLNGALSMADGHAGHEWDNVETVFNRDTLFSEARRRGPVLTARDMIAEWALIAGEPSALDALHRIAPTASVSIDIVAAGAKQLGKRVWLVDPTFDNVSQILRRREVETLGVPEARLHGDPLGVLGGLGSRDALFIVDPNNPTGTSFDTATFATIIEQCARQGVDVIVDRTFRFFGAPSGADIIGRLQRSGVGFAVIEDTGKTWPTLEIKASATFFSLGWRAAIETVFEEIFLLQSPLAMQAFADLFRIERITGFPGTLHALVEERRARLRALVAPTRLRVAPESQASTLPVEWLDISGTGMSDFALVDEIAAQTGVHLLPGRQFYWSRGDLKPHNRVRVSLLRQRHVFDESLERLEVFFRGGV